MSNHMLAICLFFGLAGCGQSAAEEEQHQSGMQTHHEQGEQAVRVPDERRFGCHRVSERVAVNLPGGPFRMGDNRAYAEESPERNVSVEAFSIDPSEITNGEFRDFVDETGYVTVAERAPDPALIPEGAPPEYYEPGAAVFRQPESAGESWWHYVAGANWRHPKGPGSSIEGKEGHPVVQVGLEDARAYAEWAGRRLPTEAEWEFAARGGLEGATFSWGETPPTGKDGKANTWQGMFPYSNTEDDGYAGTAPAGCFEPNGYGLYDMAGNVWEWTSSSYSDSSGSGEAVHTIKGGSFLCAPNFCFRYRPAARQGQEVGLPSNHIGFRTAGETKRQ